MARTTSGNSKHLPIVSADQVRHFTGPVSDHTVAEILGIAPSTEDLEVAVIYSVGEGDIAGIEGHELSGKPARIYEILAADELYQLDDR
jgi:hypothetical protein